jgi:hypothetical protein
LRTARNAVQVRDASNWAGNDHEQPSPEIGCRRKDEDQQQRERWQQEQRAHQACGDDSMLMTDAREIRWRQIHSDG